MQSSFQIQSTLFGHSLLLVLLFLTCLVMCCQWFDRCLPLLCFLSFEFWISTWTHLHVFTDVWKFLASVNAVMESLQVIARFLSCSETSLARIVVFCMQSTLLLSVTPLTPMNPLGKPNVKLFPGTAVSCLVGKFPSWSVTNFGHGMLLSHVLVHTVFLFCLRGPLTSSAFVTYHLFCQFFDFRAKQQSVTDLLWMIGIVSKAAAVETNRK